MTTTRLERDPLGEKPVPADALYGIQTLRAAENFPISGHSPNRPSDRPTVRPSDRPTA